MVFKVKDIMSKPVYTIGMAKTAQDAGRLMSKIRRGCLVITKKGKPVGIISDSDLIKRVVAKNFKADKLKLEDIMSKPIITVHPDDDVSEAIKKMKKSNIHRLPVISEGRLLGLISLSDIAKTSPEMLDLLDYRTRMRELPTEINEEFASGICDSCGNFFERLQNVNDQWLCESCKDELEKE